MSKTVFNNMIFVTVSEFDLKYLLTLVNTDLRITGTVDEIKRILPVYELLEKAYEENKL